MADKKRSLFAEVGDGEQVAQGAAQEKFGG